MKTLIYTLVITTASLSCKAQVYTIPWAQVQPAWVFPLWFEDASGAKDTLYLAYDPNSGDPFNAEYDSIFGDNHLIVLDTTKFQVYNGCSVGADLLISKSNCTNEDFQYIDFCSWKCQLPLTIRWDVNLFRSNVLPFPDLSPAPRAQGLLWYDLPFQTALPCSYSVPVLISDSIIISGDCYRIDSISFYNNPPIYGLSDITIYIVPWTGKSFTSTSIFPKNAVEVYPNPCSEKLNVVNLENVPTLLTITNLYGEIVFKKDLTADCTISIETIPTGIYILQLSSIKKSQSIKLLKL